MSRLLSKPLTKTYEIEDWSVTFAQMTDGDLSAIGDIEHTRDVRVEGNQFMGWREVRNIRRSERLGCYRTMVSCNLAWDEDGEEKEVFPAKDGRVRNAMTETQFNRQWDLLPVDVADQLVEKFRETNPSITGES